MLAINAILISTFVVWPYANRSPDIQVEYVNLLKSWQPVYMWDGNSFRRSTSLSTVVWDGIQSRGCCGIDGAQDWSAYEPEPNVYPRTCCSHKKAESEKFCTDNNADEHLTMFHEGCRGHITWLEGFIVKYFCGFIVYHFWLIVVAILESRQKRFLHKMKVEQLPDDNCKQTAI